ncbi:MAG: hypothetical protein HKN79_10330 [Flavobacteriales bacterium]|nr:hypothetical protein [Flavobacteriales bacterium]
MKKISIALMFFVSSTLLYAGGEEIKRLDQQTVLEMSEEDRTMRVNELEDRLVQLQEIDFKQLERAEKKEVRSELRYIKKEMRAHANHGVYISGAGLIIIILLAILIF